MACECGTDIVHPFEEARDQTLAVLLRCYALGSDRQRSANDLNAFEVTMHKMQRTGGGAHDAYSCQPRTVDPSTGGSIAIRGRRPAAGAEGEMRVAVVLELLARNGPTLVSLLGHSSRLVVCTGRRSGKRKPHASCGGRPNR